MLCNWLWKVKLTGQLPTQKNFLGICSLHKSIGTIATHLEIVSFPLLYIVGHEHVMTFAESLLTKSFANQQHEKVETDNFSTFPPGCFQVTESLCFPHSVATTNNTADTSSVSRFSGRNDQHHFETKGEERSLFTEEAT